MWKYLKSLSSSGTSSSAAPARDRWLARAVLLAFILAYAIDTYAPLTDAPIRGAFLGAIWAGITVVAGWLADKAVTVAVIVWEVLRTVGRLLWDFAILVGRVFIRVYEIFARFWSQVLKPAINALWDQVGRFARWLNTAMKPVISFLQRVRTEIAKFYDRFFKPIFDTIDAIRRVLRVLAALHVEFARELDRKLSELEARLLAPIQLAMRRINQVIDVVDRIVTFDGLLQRITLLASLTGYQGDWLNLWWNAQTPELTAEERRRLLTGGDALTIAEVGAETRRYLQVGGGDMRDVVATGTETARAYLELAA